MVPRALHTATIAAARACTCMRVPHAPARRLVRQDADARSRRTLLATGGCVEADLLLQPPVPIDPRLLREGVSRLIPANLLGLRRGRVQLLRLVDGYVLVQPPVL